jgi:NRAMP (natural resistance-associated macrophage protein)-like metal ion transporter
MPTHIEASSKKRGSPAARNQAGRLRRFFSVLGPGLITGAADDDPSGISTYSVAGARFGYAVLWTAWYTLPLIAAVQLMCSRLGMVSGRGLGALIARRYPRWVLWSACTLLVIANVINIGADLAGMSATTASITGIDTRYLAPFYAGLIFVLLAASSYRRVATTLKWMTLVLFAYVLSGFLARPDWPAVFHATLIPHIDWSRDYWATLVAILGTTISPYLFFWQASEEVEEERAAGKTTVKQRRSATDAEIRDSRADVNTGMVLSNLIMYFIILTTGATIHVQGGGQIETAQQAAQALRPLAGAAAYLLFTLGIVGTGLLTVPVLAGSTAYAIGDAAGWHNSLSATPKTAPRFYAVLGVSIAVGLVLTYSGLNVISMLFWSAVVNGVLAPPLIVLVVLLSSDSKIMGRHVCSPWLRSLGWLTAIGMTFAAIAMLASLV